MAIQTAKIQAVINGITVTIAEVALPDPATVTGISTVMANAQTVAVSLARPLKIDPDSIITLVTAQASTSSVATATLHISEQKT